MDQSNLTPAVFELDDGADFYFGLHDPKASHSAGLAPIFPRAEVERMKDEDEDIWNTLRECGVDITGAFIDLGPLGWTWATAQIGVGREYFLQPITSRHEAEQFILRLERDGFGWHPDDNPADIERIGTWERVFTDAEAAALRVRASELFEHMGSDHPYRLFSACTNAEGGPIYRLERLSPNGAMVETGDDALIEYHTLEWLHEDHPETAKDVPTVDAEVGEAVGPYWTDDIGAFQLTRLQ